MTDASSRVAPAELPLPRAVVLAAFFLSGATGLTYEVVWMRQLQLTVGATGGAVSIVLATFMLGLAVGAGTLGRLADRTRSPLKIYGALEIGIGLYAVAFPSLLAGATPTYVAIAQQLQDQPGAVLALRLSMAALLLLPPTTLMGATLPFLVRCVGRDASGFGRQLGMLYGANVAGAVAGAGLTGFVLIKELGITGATTTAVIVNLAVGTVMLLAPRQDGFDREAATPISTPMGGSVTGGLRQLLWAVIFFSGFVTMGYEILWTRALVFSFKSTVYSFTIILCTFLMGLSLGSWLFAARLDGRPRPLRTLALAQMSGSVLVLVLLPAGIRLAWPLLSSAESRSSPRVVGAAVVACLTLLLPTVLMGIVFPLSSRLLTVTTARAGRTIGGAYALNTVGSVLGSLLVPFILIPLLSTRLAFALLAVVQLALGLWVWLSAREASSARWTAAGASVGALMLALAMFTRLLPGPASFDVESMVRGSRVELVAHHDSAQSSVSVVRHSDGTTALRIDGFEAAADSVGGYEYMRMMTHIPMLLHPSPRRLLVISFGTGTTTGTGTLYPDTRVDAVDIERAVFDFAPNFREDNLNVADDPRVRLIVDDGRNYVLTSRDSYDVITSEPMPPTFAGMVNLYSAEYYQLARERLNEGGILVQWLPFHLLTGQQSLEILRTVQDVLPQTSLWLHQGTGIIVARKGVPLALDPAAIDRRMTYAPLQESLRRLRIGDAVDLLSLYALGPDSVRDATRDALPVTDDWPSLEFHTLASGLDPHGAMDLYTRLLQRKRNEPIPLPGIRSDLTAEIRTCRDVRTLTELSEVWVRTDNPTRAKALLQEALGKVTRPRSRSQVLHHLATVAMEEGDQVTARRLAQASLELDPHSPARLLVGQPPQAP